MKSFIWRGFVWLLTTILVVGCGGNDENVIYNSEESDAIQISGAGIKGPLASADVKLYALNPSFQDYYDRASPISIAITNQYAEINELSVPRKHKPPYILVIDGSNGIDLNSGEAPIIDTLITVITDDMLANNHPIFATPLTTLTFHMARLNSVSTPHTNKKTARNSFVENIHNAANIVSSAFVFGQDRDIDILKSPLIINEYTSYLHDQELAVYHRAAVEAFAAKVYALGLSENMSTDAIIENLALDIYGDGIIDGLDQGVLVGGIDPVILSQDPISLGIPNTPYRVEDIMLLMEEERILIGTNLGPDFLIEEIAFPEATTTAKGFAILCSGDSTVNGSDPGCDGTTRPDGLWIYLWPEQNVGTVDFYVDGIFRRTERSAPYELDGGSESNLGAGTHTVRAVVSLESGGSQETNATFTVGTTITPIEPSGSGTAVATEPVLNISGDSIDFGSLYVGETSDPIELILTNSGTVPLNILDISISSGFIEASNCGDNVPAGGDCIFDVQYVPTTNGDITGKLTIVSNAASSPDTINLTGSGMDGSQSEAVNSSVAPNAPEILFSHDFNNDNLGIYTLDDLYENWGILRPSPGTASLTDYGTTEIVADPNGTRDRVMSVFFKEGGYVYNRGVCCGGTEWRTPLKQSNELYLSYDVMFEPGFEFSLGGKLPGLYGWTDYNEFIGGGKDPDGYNGWSGRLAFKKDGGLAVYVYHAAKTRETWGENYWWNNAQFIPGKWHTLEIRYVMNTPGVANGRIQAWFDGQPALDTGEKFLFTNTDALGINGLIVTTFFGGNWPSPKNQHVYFDNFVVSTKPITH
jgi:hypothetical protein